MTDEKKLSSKQKHHHKHRPLHLGGKAIFLFVLFCCAAALAWSFLSTAELESFFIKRALVPLDISSIANTDYHLDAAVPHPSDDSKALYPDLVGGNVKWGPVHFRILRPRVIGGPEQNVYTSCNDDQRSVELPLEEKPSEALYLLVDGCNISSTKVKPVADLTIHYKNGSWEEKTLYSNRDVWMFDEERYGLYVSPDRIVWKGSAAQSLSGVYIPLDVRKTPKSLTIKTRGESDDAGLALFAVTQEKKHWFAG